MMLVSIRIIADDIKRLVGFYQAVTGMTPTWYTDDYAELRTSVATLAIASTRTVALFGTDSARPAANRSMIVEFKVDDVDEAYRRSAAVIDDVVQEPTTMPWGNRSLLFRDPDGHLVNLYTPVTEQAISRFEQRMS